jgi:hypothetical protein
MLDMAEVKKNGDVCREMRYIHSCGRRGVKGKVEIAMFEGVSRIDKEHNDN